MPSDITSASTASPAPLLRHHEIDWLRTIALILLIVYHIAISFQPWAGLIYFIPNNEPVTWLWIPMSLLNVWRIPILFLIAGMGARFAMERRSWQQLLGDRTLRILVPFVFGYFAICPLLPVIVTSYYDLTPVYVPNVGHLWFLGNIFVYVVVLLPLLHFLRKHPNARLLKVIKVVGRWPILLLLFAVPMIISATLTNPDFFSSYAESWHGFWLGFVCFFVGILFVSVRAEVWSAAQRLRWYTVALASGLFLVRLLVYELEGVPHALTALESTCWMLAVLGFATLHLTQPSRALTYLSKSVYPIYIIHLPVQFALTYALVPLELPALVKFGILLVGTFALCALIYEAVLRRLGWFRLLFGIAIPKKALG